MENFELKFRKAQKPDFDRIFEIWFNNQDKSIGLKEFDLSTKRKVKEEMVKHFKSYHTIIYVAINETNQIVGWQGIFPVLVNPILGSSLAQINTYIDHNFSYANLGKRLMSYTLKAAREKGIEHIYAWVTADNRAGNILANSFSSYKYLIPKSKNGNIPNLNLYIVDVN